MMKDDDWDNLYIHCLNGFTQPTTLSVPLDERGIFRVQFSPDSEAVACNGVLLLSS